MNSRLLSITLALSLLSSVLPGAQAQKPATIPAPFHPPGMWTWDNWFAHDGKRWHAFYLQLPKAVGLERRWKDNDFYKHVGHAISTDLRTWQDQGSALCALSGTWNDRHIATGSVMHFEGRWWMAFTGRGTKGGGVGLAVSDDLTKWQPAQSSPIFPLTGTFGGDVEGGVFTSSWQGKTQHWVGISDPYLVPEVIDGWIYLVLCARVLDVPLAQSGCLAVLKSRDLRHWQQPTMIAWPRCFERMETPQLWTRQGRWYLSFGGVLDNKWAKEHASLLPEAVRDQPSHRNYCYSMDTPDGPADDALLQHVAAPRGHYIMKVLPVTADQDVAIFTVADRDNSSISPPYPVTYRADHSMQINVSSANQSPP